LYRSPGTNHGSKDIDGCNPFGVNYTSIYGHHQGRPIDGFDNHADRDHAHDIEFVSRVVPQDYKPVRGNRDERERDQVNGDHLRPIEIA
jgi:hypothetical protein